MRYTNNFVQVPQEFFEYKCMCVCTYSFMSDSLQPHGLSSARLLCSLNFPGKNTGVGFHFLLQRSLPNPGTESISLESSALPGGFFTNYAAWEA